MGLRLEDMSFTQRLVIRRAIELDNLLVWDHMEPHGDFYICLHLMIFLGAPSTQSESFPYLLLSLDPLILCFNIFEYNFMVSLFLNFINYTTY